MDSIPCRESKWESRSPAGPAPIIPTWVRMSLCTIEDYSYLTAAHDRYEISPQRHKAHKVGIDLVFVGPLCPPCLCGEMIRLTGSSVDLSSRLSLVQQHERRR